MKFSISISSKLSFFDLSSFLLNIIIAMIIIIITVMAITIPTEIPIMTPFPLLASVLL